MSDDNNVLPFVRPEKVRDRAHPYSPIAPVPLEEDTRERVGLFDNVFGVWPVVALIIMAAVVGMVLYLMPTPP